MDRAFLKLWIAALWSVAICAGEKTHVMREALERGGVCLKGDSLLLDGITYQLLSSGPYPSSSKSWISPSELPFSYGALYYDKGMSLALEQAYEQFCQKVALTSPCSLEEALKLALFFVRDHLFRRNLGGAAQCDLLAQVALEWKGPLPAISLDCWVGAGVGTCKPMSSTLLFLLRRAIEDGLSPFDELKEIFFVRGYISTVSWERSLERSGHAWAEAISATTSWLLDPAWGRMWDLTSPDSLQCAREIYGQDSLAITQILSEK